MDEAVKCPQCGSSLNEHGECLNGHKTQAKGTSIPKTFGMEVHKEGVGEVRMIAGKFPKDFDPTNKDMVKKFVLDTLKEAGELPPGLTDAQVDVVMGEPGGEGDVAARLSHFHSMKASDSLKDIPQPADPAKAEFIRCFNTFHRRVHDMGPMTADLLQSLECMKLNLKGPAISEKEKQTFKLFNELVNDVVDAFGKCGEMACILHGKLNAKGLPVPDAGSNTIN